MTLKEYMKISYIPPKFYKLSNEDFLILELLEIDKSNEGMPDSFINFLNIFNEEELEFIRYCKSFGDGFISEIIRYPNEELSDNFWAGNEMVSDVIKVLREASKNYEKEHVN